jgi:hypothetical protein
MLHPLREPAALICPLLLFPHPAGTNGFSRRLPYAAQSNPNWDGAKGSNRQNAENDKNSLIY